MQKRVEETEIRERALAAIDKFLDSKGSRNVDVFTALPCIMDFVHSEAERAIAESQAPQPYEELRKYGKHLTACACFDEFDEKACDCGFSKYEV